MNKDKLPINPLLALYKTSISPDYSYVQHKKYNGIVCIQMIKVKYWATIILNKSKIEKNELQVHLYWKLRDFIYTSLPNSKCSAFDSMNLMF
jgi:hypothetical protein